MTFTYFETFAGTGIAGIALDEIGGQCIGYSEINKHAIKNYEANFGERTNYGDITEINIDELPDFDLLVGGTPCTDISLASRKWWGKTKEEGLKGKSSHLFFNFAQILNEKLPKWFIFENVKQLLHTNNGEDWSTVLSEFSKYYNYTASLMNTKEYGLPHNRRRIYIIGQRKDLGDFSYTFPPAEPLTSTVYDLLDKDVDAKYYATEKGLGYILSEGTKNFKSKPEIDLDIARPLSATMHKWHRAGADNYYTAPPAPSGKSMIRRLTPREAARLQGLPDSYKIVVSDTQAYILMGNAMSLNVVRKIASNLAPIIATKKGGVLS